MGFCSAGGRTWASCSGQDANRGDRQLSKYSGARLASSEGVQGVLVEGDEGLLLDLPGTGHDVLLPAQGRHPAQPLQLRRVLACSRCLSCLPSVTCNRATHLLYFTSLHSTLLYFIPSYLTLS